MPVNIIHPEPDKELSCKEQIKASTSSKHEETSEKKKEPCTSPAMASTDMDNRVKFPNTVKQMFTPLWEAIQSLEDVDRSDEAIDDFLKDLEFLVSSPPQVQKLEEECSHAELKIGVEDA